mmetsp:Transcript_51557/g.122639  ORF Transcript_51557/g.122639 Transcript_51557/m.122639 type:complete len:427 (-) Transcript_51557:178-1458(-)
MFGAPGARSPFPAQAMPPPGMNTNTNGAGRQFDRAPLLMANGNSMKYGQPPSFHQPMGVYPSFNNKAGQSFQQGVMPQVPTQPSMYVTPQTGFSNGAYPAGGYRGHASRGLASNALVGNGNIPTASKPGCENQECAEEECDPKECGDENHGPERKEEFCGLDRRPLLPLALAASTLIFAACMLGVQLPLLGQWSVVLMAICYVIWILIYLVVLVTMVYCALCDPGQLKERQSKAYQKVQDGKGGDIEEQKMPRRAHKCWMYDLPMRRYDHYCRWLMNVIALLNHREFILLLIGLVTIGVLGIIFDLVVFIGFVASAFWLLSLLVVAHFIYCIIMLSLVFPIFRIHVGLVSRNELAAEWKKNTFYVVTRQRNGEVVPVSELSDEEFNEEFDNFTYDGSKNPWDEGVASNCWVFWCTSRWSADQLGEF